MKLAFGVNHVMHLAIKAHSISSELPDDIFGLYHVCGQVLGILVYKLWHRQRRLELIKIFLG